MNASTNGSGRKDGGETDLRAIKETEQMRLRDAGLARGW